MLIAELCQNHNGSPDLLYSMVYQAAIGGASHAKIQNLYSWELSYRSEYESRAGEMYRPYFGEFERLRKLDLDPKTESLFVSTCKALNITPMVTVFTHEGANRAKEAGFRSIKIASYDCASLPLIESVLNFADELVVSTGATSWEKVTRTAEYLSTRDSQSIALLHATTAYPNTLENANLGRMGALEQFGLPVGYSDHTGTLDSHTANATSKAAIILGAQVLERHFTVLPPGATKDGPVSIDTIRLADLANFFEDQSGTGFVSAEEKIAVEELLATSDSFRLEPNDEELMNARYYRGRVVSRHAGLACFSWDHCVHQTIVK